MVAYWGLWGGYRRMYAYGVKAQPNGCLNESVFVGAAHTRKELSSLTSRRGREEVIGNSEKVRWI